MSTPSSGRGTLLGLQEPLDSLAVGLWGFETGKGPADANDLQLGAPDRLADRPSLRRAAEEVEVARDDERRRRDLGEQGPQVDRLVQPGLPRLDRGQVEGDARAQRVQAGRNAGAVRMSGVQR